MQGTFRAAVLDASPVAVTAKLPALRPRVPSRVLVRAEAANAARDDGKVINNVLFTIPKRLEYGQCLCLTGEGEWLGEWAPANSLQLKWNEGDVWGAEVQLPAGQQLEYKYIVRLSDGNLANWQPGENCAIKVPAGSGHRLQVIDDWLGKSRSVVYDDGEIGTPPHGTFDASMEIEEAQHDGELKAQSPANDDSSSDDLGETSAVQPSSTSDQAAELAVQPMSSATDQPAHDEDEASNDNASNDAQGISPANNSLEEGLNELKVKDLKDRLKERGLPVSGRKAELIDRLKSFEEED